MSNPEVEPQGQPGIPVISAETLEALKSQYIDNSGDGQTWGERLTSMQEKIAGTNPNLVSFIEMQVGGYHEDLHLPMFEVLLGVMVLIERQADASSMYASLYGADFE